MSVSDPHRLYYLHNFQQALTWLEGRYADLFRPDEIEFVQGFRTVPEAARALFVRMAMRKGPLFRTSKLQYDEIGCPLAAMQPLVERGWVDPHPALTLDEVMALLTRQEAQEALQHMTPPPRLRKAELLAWLHERAPASLLYRQWWTAGQDTVLLLRQAALCERLRAMFFGNLRQQWSEFVLADLGVFRYETVCMESHSRPFSSAEDVDHFLVLHACRQGLAADAPLPALLAQLDALPTLDSWLGVRAARLRFLIGQRAEKQQDWPLALACYAGTRHPGARFRRLRVLERSGDVRRALSEAIAALGAPESEEERQCVHRMLPRLRRLAGLPSEARTALLSSAPATRVALPRDNAGLSVERVVQAHLSTQATPVFYVENVLVNGLFGLLCWDAIFAAVPGAFFHPFQSGPADLLSPDFRSRRVVLLDSLLAQLDTPTWRDTIRSQYAAKYGIYSPFVAWSALTPELLELALQCIAPGHLRVWFNRILDDIKANRTGWPDLIQFYPAESRYRLVEVKGPGDRLQDNQRRWLDVCMRHDIPVEVTYVEWTAAAA